MRTRNWCFPFLLAVLTAAGFQRLPNSSIQLQAAPQANKFEELAKFKYGGGVLGTGIRGKGGFTVVPMDAAAGCSKFAVSFAVIEDQQLGPSDFRVVAADVTGKRQQARVESGVSAGGNGIIVITVVSEFNIGSDKIDSLVIQQRVKGKKVGVNTTSDFSTDSRLRPH
jgi:hypothetical protein